MLAPFTMYSTVIEAFTVVGSGPCSTPYTFTTGEDGTYIHTFACFIILSMYCLPFAVPLLAPTNASGIVLDSRTLHFSWEALPPEHHNGVLQGYNISITEEENEREFHLSTAVTMLTVPSLHPAYTYEWRVAAFTRVGVGPYSFPPNRIKTDEDGN